MKDCKIILNSVNWEYTHCFRRVYFQVVHILSSWHVTTMIQQEVITELSVMKIYLNSHKQRLGVTSLSARLLSLGTLPPSRGHPSRLGPHSAPVQTFFYSIHIPHDIY